MVSLRGIICNFKHVALVIIGTSLLTFSGCTVTSGQSTELDNVEYAVDINTDISDGYEWTAGEIVGDSQLLYHQWTIEELGDIIVSAGTFWNDWWYGTDRFSYLNTGSWEDIHADIYLPLLPSSGFENLNDIRNYLLQYYTVTWVNNLLGSDFTPFVEYEDRLYVHSIRAGFTRTNWETAIIARIEQKYPYDFIYVSALNSAWHMLPNLIWCGNRDDFFIEAQNQIINGETYIFNDARAEDAISEVQYRIIFVDGRINNILFVYDDCREWSIFE